MIGEQIGLGGVAIAAIQIQILVIGIVIAVMGVAIQPIGIQSVIIEVRIAAIEIVTANAGLPLDSAVRLASP